MLKKIYPSIYAANIGYIKETLEEIESLGIDTIHVDVMDGNFVENIAFGIEQIHDMKQLTKLKFDVHLMVNNIEKNIDKLIEIGVERVSFHIENASYIHIFLSKLKKNGIKAGIAINPETSLSSLDYILDDIDFILIMSVSPGANHQTFKNSTYHKINQIKNLINQRAIKIEIDGGITYESAIKCYENGADELVIGKALMQGNFPKNLEKFKQS